MTRSRPFQLIRAAVCKLALAATVCAGFGAEIIYDNTSNFLTTYATEQREYGDQLDLTGSERILTELSFEYFAEFSQEGNEFCKVRIYTNEKRYDLYRKSPTTLLWESGFIGLNPGFHSRRMAALNVPLPDSITVTIEFFGFEPGESAGLLLYSPPTLGHSFNEFWGRNPDGSWAPFLYSVNDPGLKANAGIRLKAVSSGSKDVVSVVASSRPAVEAPLAETSFTFRREGNLQLPLTISYDLEGTAQAGPDFTIAPNDSPRVSKYQIQFPAGASEAVVYVRPKADNVAEEVEKVTARIQPRADFEIRTGWASATVLIQEDPIFPVKMSVQPGPSSLRMEIAGELGRVHYLEQSADFRNWKRIRTNLVFSPVWIANVPIRPGEKTNYFYRVTRKSH